MFAPQSVISYCKLDTLPGENMMFQRKTNMLLLCSKPTNQPHATSTNAPYWEPCGNTALHPLKNTTRFHCVHFMNSECTSRTMYSSCVGYALQRLHCSVSSVCTALPSVSCPGAFVLPSSFNPPPLLLSDQLLLKWL